MNTFEEQTEYLADVVILASLDDERWKRFGFKGSPKRGILFDRFVNKDKLAIERFVLLEIALLALIDVICAINDKGFTDDLRGSLTLATLTKVYAQYKNAKVFSDATSFVDFVRTGVSDYAKHEDAFLQRTLGFLNHNSINSALSGDLFKHALEMHSNMNTRWDNRSLVYKRASISQRIDKVDNTGRMRITISESEFPAFASLAEHVVQTAR